LGDILEGDSRADFRPIDAVTPGRGGGTTRRGEETTTRESCLVRDQEKKRIARGKTSETRTYFRDRCQTKNLGTGREKEHIRTTIGGGSSLLANVLQTCKSLLRERGGNGHYTTSSGIRG